MSIDAPDLPALPLDEAALEAAALDERAADEVAGAPVPAAQAARAEKPAAIQSFRALVLTSLAAFLASAAAGWVVGGTFRGVLPRVAGVVAAAIGCGIVAWSYRTRQPAFVQALVVPVAAAFGALLVIPDAGGGGANLPSLVLEALRNGGIAQPPIPFDPGWRFILVVVIAALSAGASALAIGLDRPKLGIVVPLPVVFGAVLIQPQKTVVLSTVVALVLGVSAMAVAYGVELAREGATSGRFEVRRLARGGGVAAVLVVALVALSQLGFLFPNTNKNQVIPPRRPETPPAERDRVLFTVEADRALPWRLGVLDVYDGKGFMTPPFDPARLLPVKDDGLIPYAGKDVAASTQPVPVKAGPDQRVTATFKIADVPGHVVPTLPEPLHVTKRGFALVVDPRTQSFRLPDNRARPGTSYTVEAVAPPDAAALSAAGPAPARLSEFQKVPPPPPEVAALLAQAPAAPQASAFERLQFVRNAFYSKVVAAGAGNPKDVPPARVADMLAGKPASPFEITAADVLLARWVGLPARFAYGYYGGDAVGNDGKTREIRPKDGATWLEAYFEGHGWVPILGTPPQAKSSLSQDRKKHDPTVRPTDELAMVVYIPVRVRTARLLYVVARYWLWHLLPYAVALLLAVLFYPGLIKLLRRQRRRRWAQAYGVRERVAAAYAEVRDLANDLNVGTATDTPLEFLQSVAPDAELKELSWLVTRVIWGDLVRDLREDDAAAAEEMAQSVTRRMRRGSTALARMIAFGSRASLRDPYSREMPNLWPRRRRFDVRGTLRLLTQPRAWLRRRTVASAPVAIVLVVLAVAGLGSCGRRSAAAEEPGRLPARLAPDAAAGLTLRREQAAEAKYKKVAATALVSAGRVFSIHQDDDLIQGSLQIAAFKPRYLATDEAVRKGVLAGIGSGRFQLVRLGQERVYQLVLPEQTIYAWFPPNGEWFDLMIARRGFNDADQFFQAVIAFQRTGNASVTGASTPGPALLDPRRGNDE